MKTNNGDLPAMPISEEETDRIDAGGTIYTGLSKREMFAMAAMQGIMANSNCAPTNEQHFLNIAADSLAASDALLAELEKSQ